MKRAILLLSFASLIAACATPQKHLVAPSKAQARTVRVERPGPEWVDMALLGVNGPTGVVLTNDDPHTVIMVFSVPAAGRTAFAEAQDRRLKQAAVGDVCSEVSVSDDRAAFQTVGREWGSKGATVVLQNRDWSDTLVVVRAKWSADADDTFPGMLSRVIKSIRVE